MVIFAKKKVETFDIDLVGMKVICCHRSIRIYHLLPYNVFSHGQPKTAVGCEKYHDGMEVLLLLLL